MTVRPPELHSGQQLGPVQYIVGPLGGPKFQGFMRWLFHGGSRKRTDGHADMSTVYWQSFLQLPIHPVVQACSPRREARNPFGRQQFCILRNDRPREDIMHQATYDDLRQGGFDEKQALVIASHIPDWSQCTTKSDVKDLEHQMETLEHRMTGQMSELQGTIIRWMIGIFLTFLSAFSLLLTAANFLQG